MSLSSSLLNAALKGTTTLKAGRHADGRNLYLNVNKAGAMSWLFMYKPAGAKWNREIGLGSFTGEGATFRLTLAEARLKADEVRVLIAKGIDPTAEKKAAKLAAKSLFRDLLDRVIETRKGDWKPSNRAKQEKDWRGLFDRRAAALLDMPVAAITFDTVVDTLKPFWKEIAKKAEELRGRIEVVLARAIDDGLRSGPNPAAWNEKMERALGKRYSTDDAVAHAAMDWSNVPSLFARLAGEQNIAFKAMLFAILNVNRASEAREVRWSEIDLDRALWTIPGGMEGRMKDKKGGDHEVPLSTQAVAILRSITPVEGNPYVFAGEVAGKPINASAFQYKREQLGITETMHGFRATFRTWTSKRKLGREAAEKALHHRVGNKTENAYNRDDHIAERRDMLQAWADHCHGVSNVIRLAA